MNFRQSLKSGNDIVFWHDNLPSFSESKDRLVRWIPLSVADLTRRMWLENILQQQHVIVDITFSIKVPMDVYVFKRPFPFNILYIYMPLNLVLPRDETRLWVDLIPSRDIETNSDINFKAPWSRLVLKIRYKFFHSFRYCAHILN